MSRYGDRASQVASDLHDDHEKMLQDGGNTLDQTVGMEDYRRELFRRIQFKWRDSDALILTQIEEAAKVLLSECFDDAITVIDDFYHSLRLPEVNEHGIVRLNAKGRPIWKKDEHGKYIEDWDQLTGQDIEASLLQLQRVRLTLSQRVKELELEAVFAKHIHDDSWTDSYSSLLQGTIGDREARANKDSRLDKYHAFFRYYLWTLSDTLLKEIVNLQWLMKDIREWRVRTQKG